MKSGSLFAGFGGLDLATRDALGATTAWVAETDGAASAVLTHRFPGTPNHGDVTAIDWAAVEPVPVLKAGYPCQGESDAGNRLGDRDPRWLWPAYRATIETAARLADWAGLPLDAFTNRTQTIHHPTADQTRAALTALQAAVDATETLRHLLRHTPTD